MDGDIHAPINVRGDVNMKKYMLYWILINIFKLKNNGGVSDLF